MRKAGIITLRRKANFAASLRKLDVLVDGKRIGNIANGAERHFEVGTGWHRVEVKLLAGSELLAIDLSPNDSVELECGISRQFWIRLLLVATGILVLSSFNAPALIHLLMLVVSIFLAVGNFRRGGTYYLKRVHEA